jgi:hypothetical protein
MSSVSFACAAVEFEKKKKGAEDGEREKRGEGQDRTYTS